LLEYLGGVIIGADTLFPSCFSEKERTKLVVDNNGPGFELRIKDSEKTESIKAN